MKKISVLATASALLLAGCTKSISEKQEEPVADAGLRHHCASYDVLQTKLNEDPALQQRMDAIESFTARYVAAKAAGNLEENSLGADGITMTIPVHVNVLYNTAAQNISDQQIQSQIDVLNEDFSGTNADVNTTNTYQSVKAGNTNIRFVLVGVTRKQTSVSSWGLNDAMKRASSGGIDATNPTTTLNMWSCLLTNGWLGYAQFPGGTAATDGVVITTPAFGSRAKYPQGTYSNNFDLGRTATHEVGHWLGLRHIWGDKRCGNDAVSDTPPHDVENYGCPAANTISRCAGRPVEMTMNYMDYTNDVCMYMFSQGQEDRMRASFAVGGPRASFRP